MMHKTTFTPALRRFLKKNWIANLNLLGIIQNESVAEILVDDEDDPKGVLVRAPRFHYVYTEDDAFLEALYEEMLQKPAFYQFSGVWRPLAEKLKTRFPVMWDNPCKLYHLPEDVRPPSCANTMVQSVDVRDAETIDQHYAYRNSTSLDKIQNCIQNRPSSAVYVNGQIACWLLVHEDDALGIMYTKEEHRRKGLAVDVTLDLLAKQRSAGKIPFIQICTDNDLSPGLATKCGFVPYGRADWFGIVVGTPREMIEFGVRFRRYALETFASVEAVIDRPGLRVTFPGQTSPTWVVSPLDDTGTLKALGETDHLGLEREIAGLYLLFHEIKEELPSEDNPVTETKDDEEWLAFCAKHKDVQMLRTALASRRKDFRLLWEQRGGEVHAAVALLVDSYNDCELLLHTSDEPRFLRHALKKAKSLNLDVCFTHVPMEEQAPFQAAGFMPLYVEKHYRNCEE